MALALGKHEVCSVNTATPKQIMYSQEGERPSLERNSFYILRFEHFTHENQNAISKWATLWIISFKWILSMQCWSNSGWDHLRQSQEDEI